MSGCHDKTAPFVQIGKDCCSKSGTLGRICSGSQLIKKHETVCISLLQNGYGIDHMGGKCTQALFNTLLISDISVNFMEYFQ